MSDGSNSLLRIQVGGFFFSPVSSELPKYTPPCFFSEISSSDFVNHASCCVVIAEALQLPLIPPILPKKDSGEFPHGANFATVGATARGLRYSGPPSERYRGSALVSRHANGLVGSNDAVVSSWGR